MTSEWSPQGDRSGERRLRWKIRDSREGESEHSDILSFRVVVKLKRREYNQRLTSPPATDYDTRWSAAFDRAAVHREALIWCARCCPAIAPSRACDALVTQTEGKSSATVTRYSWFLAGLEHPEESLPGLGDVITSVRHERERTHLLGMLFCSERRRHHRNVVALAADGVK